MKVDEPIIYETDIATTMLSKSMKRLVKHTQTRQIKNI